MTKNKRIFRFVIALVFSLTIVLGTVIPVSAAEIRKELITLQSKTNLLISVVYDDDGSGTEPVISFRSPTGGVYDEKTMQGGMSVEHDPANRTIWFAIPDAQAGKWDIVYDSAFSNRLTVRILPYTRDFWITDFNYTINTSGTLSANFLVSFPTRVMYEYVLSVATLDADGNISAKKEINRGNAYTNTGKTVNFLMNALSGYEEYYLVLDVYCDDNGIEVWDSLVSETPFSYQNPYAPSMLDDYIVRYNRKTGELFVDWTDCLVYGAQQYVVGIEADGEEVYANTIDRNAMSSISTFFTPPQNEICVKLSYLKNGIAAESNIVRIPMTSDTLEIVTETVTMASQAEISYSFSQPTEAEIIVGDTASVFHDLEQSGVLTANLAEGTNHVIARYYLTEFVSIVDEKDIYVDKTAPFLIFFEDVLSLTVNDSEFVLTGEAEAGCKILVGESVYETDVNGIFSIPLSLKAGENQFSIKAADAVGNQTMRNIVITKAENADGTSEGLFRDEMQTWLPYVILLSVILIAILVLAVRFSTKKRTKLSKWQHMMIASFAVTLTALGIWIVLLIQKSHLHQVLYGTTFLEYVKESIVKAFEAITQYRGYENVCTVFLVLTIAFLVVSLAFLLVYLLLKRKMSREPLYAAEDKAQKAAKTKCPICGAEYEGTPKYCTSCGSAL